MPGATTVVDDRHERLAGHVAAEDEDVSLVVRGGVEELPPAGLGTVDIGGEKTRTQFPSVAAREMRVKRRSLHLLGLLVPPHPIADTVAQLPLPALRLLLDATVQLLQPPLQSVPFLV